MSFFYCQFALTLFRKFRAHIFVSLQQATEHLVCLLALDLLRKYAHFNSLSLSLSLSMSVRCTLGLLDGTFCCMFTEIVQRQQAASNEVDYAADASKSTARGEMFSLPLLVNSKYSVCRTCTLEASVHSTCT